MPRRAQSEFIRHRAEPLDDAVVGGGDGREPCAGGRDLHRTCLSITTFTLGGRIGQDQMKSQALEQRLGGTFLRRQAFIEGDKANAGGNAR